MGCHNGMAWFKKEIDMKRAILAFTDASDMGMSAVVLNKWTMVPFVGHYAWMRNKSIAFRELAAIVLLLATFGPILKDRDCVMHIDNQGIQQALQEGVSKVDEIMCLIRCVYYYTSIYNICYKTLHLSSECNSSADALSRLNVVLFKRLHPRSDPLMTKPVEFILDF